jgi:hypothetical protein
MKLIARWASWIGVAMVTALLLLAVGQASSSVPPVLVFRADLNGLASGDYRGGGQALAPLSSRVIDDASRDVMSTPDPSASISSAPLQPLPRSTPTAVPPPTPTPVSTTVPTGSITGTAQGSQTTVGIANALVSLNPSELSTVTSSDGGFSFASVPAGSYTVTASAAGYQTASASVTVAAGHNANINLHLVSTVPIGSVQGAVRSSSTGNVLTGATVTLTPGLLATVTDSTGYYGLPRVTPGTYTLAVTAAGYQPFSQTITVTSGHTVKSNVSLTLL